MGIQGLRDIFEFVVAVVQAGSSKTPVILTVPRLTRLLVRAVKALRTAPAEALDLSDVEKKELRAIVENSIGKDKDLVPDKIENAVLSLLDAIRMVRKS